MLSKSRTAPHQASSDRTGGAEPDTSLDRLVAALTRDLAGPFAMMAWAEDEIARASRRHPGHADRLYHAFMLLLPRDLGPGIGTEFVYRSHAAELLDRLATGGDTRAATAAELCLACCHVSQQAPMHGPAAGLYFRLWQKAFPQHPATADQADQQVHYENLFGGQIDDLEAELRRKTVDPTRRLADIECAGRHHGQQVACRYATAPASRRSGKARG
ncbi:MAG TPA: hypothetical protein VFC00_40530 [Micromonosporaceae bacterium]|nr:hypothetical protein [Micromonosporaceae bacterium]